MNLYLFFYILAWAMAGKENGKLRNQTVLQRAGHRCPRYLLPAVPPRACGGLRCQPYFFRLALVLAPQSTPAPGGDGWLGHRIAHAGKADQRQPVEPQ
ncbi:hypothetical protein EV681_3819 [Advenella incenata]|uniref:Uncharacterized protein n=1 Tax=Advenella incenata TaxID=267800 RepID=A0A4Q7V8L2_9BURK|nr:hypothetical protein EV681_3819 [Advenella incenata]